MFVKSLLFIIVLIFVYETYKNLTKLKQEYFTDVIPQPDIKHYETNEEDINNVNYSRYKPLQEYDKDRKYFWNRELLIPEGYRRFNDVKQDILKLKQKYAMECDQEKKEIIKNEIYTIENGDDNNINNDIQYNTTKYLPMEIGQLRPWMEIHSHIPTHIY